MKMEPDFQSRRLATETVVVAASWPADDTAIAVALGIQDPVDLGVPGNFQVRFAMVA